jgi:hypothetical protein
VPIARPRSFAGKDALMSARLLGTRSAAPSQLAVGHIIAPTFHHFQCAVLFEDRSSRIGGVLPAIGHRHGANKSIHVAHDFSFRVFGFGLLMVVGLL